MSEYAAKSSLRGAMTLAPTDTLSVRLQRLVRTMWKHRWMYLLLIAPLTYYAIFRYIPIYNAQIAFKDFRALLGVEGSPWVGFQHFETFFNSYYFSQLIVNTVFFSTAKLILGLPIAIILAIAIHESRFLFFRSLVQTITYLPHFISWVIMFGLLLGLLSPGNGLINEGIKSFGGQPISFLSSPDWFRQIVISSDIWKETGWSTILYLAALLGINPDLYEAAEVDGASRWRRIWHISLPGIIPVMVLITLLRLGNILDAGFNQIFVLYSVPVYSVGDIIDTWVYRSMLDFQFSVGTAVGLFKGVFGLILILVANHVAKRVANQSLF
ncbi:putative multiple-sugar transport system permease YteP [Anaerolineae bacterium]|nr:putative multiple-sugar transport system permease YteP [Anaerolineae bacterium]